LSTLRRLAPDANDRANESNLRFSTRYPFIGELLDAQKNACRRVPGFEAQMRAS
jgi:hypothetical protein